MKEKSFFNSIILQICHGIKSLNSNGFVHCDLKLENIMIKYDAKNDTTPIAKIIDFGSTF
jgi:serine/threonine protein kinase